MVTDEMVEKAALVLFNRMRGRRKMRPVDYIGANDTPECNECREEARASLEAVDDIERLVKERDEARAENERLVKERDQLKEENQKMKEMKEAIISLLYTDLVFIGSQWEDFSNPEKGCWPVFCVHTNSFGADAEEIPSEEIIPLAALVKQFGPDAIEGWVAFRRGTEKPQKGNMPPDGKRALDYLRAQTTLNSEKY